MKTKIGELNDFLKIIDRVKLDQAGVFKYILIDIIDNSSKKALTFIRGKLTRLEVV